MLLHRLGVSCILNLRYFQLNNRFIGNWSHHKSRKTCHCVFLKMFVYFVCISNNASITVFEEKLQENIKISHASLINLSLDQNLEMQERLVQTTVKGEDSIRELTCLNTCIGRAKHYVFSDWDSKDEIIVFTVSELAPMLIIKVHLWRGSGSGK